jgi:exodeoxyribonuclease V gamma subunit
VLSITVADSLEVLAARLCAVLAEPTTDPLAADWVAVPPGGVDRWLALRLARDLGSSGPGANDGVAANITFARPGALRRAVLDAGRTLLAGGGPSPDAWTLDRMTWGALAVRAATSSPLPPLPAHLSSAAWAQRVAGRFDRYHVYRPEMIRAWAKGHDLDGAGRRLRDADRWQPALWRALRELAGEPSPPEVLPGLLEALRAGDLDLALPQRLALFGFAALPGGASFPDLVGAVASGRDVHLSVLDPCPSATWSVAADLRVGEGDAPLRHGVDVRSSLDRLHPLARSWGALAHETVALLPSGNDHGDGSASSVELVDHVVLDAPTTILEALQRAIATDDGVVLDGLSEGDRSIQVHGCQGATRQVEVLRDAVLHLLADDPTLREDDILVVCPDLARFGPLVHAVLGASAEHGVQPDHAGAAPRAPALRYRVVEPRGAAPNPMVEAFCTLLELVSGRFSAADVLAFCALEPVRRRWDFTDDDLTAMERWVAELHVRWGLDPTHRRTFGVPDAIEGGTWRRALDRLLLGVALPRDDLLVFDGALPVGVEGSDVSLLGRLTDLVGRCAELADGADQPRRVGDRLGELRRAFDQLFAPDPEMARQSEAVTRALSRLDEDARRLPEWVDALELDLAEVRALVVERLGFAGRRSAFFTGGVTITSLGSLRGVPFRVVCLLGLDEASLPAAPVDGDDLTSLVPYIGDPDRRAEARRSLLAAVAAAGTHLVVLHDDRDVASNAPVPASVVVHELLEATSAVVRAEHRAELAARVQVHHPRQATDSRCFAPGAAHPSTAWSFDPSALQGARARAARRRDRAGGPDDAPPTVLGPRPPDATVAVEADDLRLVLGDPAKFVCNRVLDVQLPGDDGDEPAHLPVGLDGLEQWGVRNRRLRDLDALDDGAEVDDLSAIEWARDTLPVGVLGQEAIDSAAELVDAVVTERRRLVGDARPELVRIDVPLPSGREIRGERMLWSTAEVTGTLDVSVSKHRAKDDLGAWVDLLLLAAFDPDPAWQAVLLRVDAKGQCAKRLRLSIDPADAPEVLTTLVALYDAARSGPIPFFPELSKALADGKGHLALAKDWTTLLQRDAPTRFLYGDVSAARLFAEPARPGDPGEGPRRAARLAAAIWDLWADTTTVDALAPATRGDDR